MRRVERDFRGAVKMTILLQGQREQKMLRFEWRVHCCADIEAGASSTVRSTCSNFEHGPKLPTHNPRNGGPSMVEILFRISSP